MIHKCRVIITTALQVLQDTFGQVLPYTAPVLRKSRDGLADMSAIMARWFGAC